MIIFKHTADLQKYLTGHNIPDRKIGFVPTMGALHAGHGSLIAASKKDNDITIVSIFVNPLQFNNPQDLVKYPVTLEKDIVFLLSLGVEILFLPDVEEIYPEQTMTEKMYNLNGLDAVYEGAFRPGHFQGVCRVMDRLLNIVLPGQLYLGQKDFQQVMVIRKLISLLDLPVNIIIGSTIREQNGLAMSSRNLRLTPSQFEKASIIYKELNWIKENRHSSKFSELKEKAVQVLKNNGMKTEYLALCNASDLFALEDFDDSVPMALLIAVFCGEVRLIDNLLL
mgnify:CR=1 FL=1